MTPRLILVSPGRYRHATPEESARLAAMRDAGASWILPTLVGGVTNKTGTFAALPDRVSLTREPDPRRPGCFRWHSASLRMSVEFVGRTGVPQLVWGRFSALATHVQWPATPFSAAFVLRDGADGCTVRLVAVQR